MPSNRLTVPRRLDLRRRLWAALAMAAVLVTPLALPAAAHAASPEDARASSARVSQTPETTPRVILVGTGGLTWDDVTPETTPALWSLAQDGAIGSLVVRSVNSTTCPADGWLALNTGRRSADAFNARSELCREMENAAPGTGVAVPAWGDYLAEIADQSYSAVPGALGDAVEKAGLAASAIGPGAAVALATSEGTVAGTSLPGPQGSAPIPATSSLKSQVAESLLTSQLVVVDLGSVRTLRHTTEIKPDGAPTVEEDSSTSGADDENSTGPSSEEVHAQDVATVDAHLAQVLAAVRADDPDLSRTLVLLASVSDPASTSRLAVTAMAGLGTDVGTLTSQSTHQPGFVQTTDVLPTVASTLGIVDDFPRGALVGSAMTSDGSADPADERVDALADADLHARVTYPLVEPFFMLYCVINLALFAVVAFCFSKRLSTAAAQTGEQKTAGGWSRLVRAVTRAPDGLLRTLRAVGVAVASLPVATLLANLTPWWRTPAPVVFLALLVIALMTAVTAAALLPPWQARVFGPLTVVATLTAAVLAVDVATGARLQVSALMGIQPVVAGRFYGFNNTAFALFATTTVLLAAAVANWFVSRGRRRAGALAVAVIGVVAVGLNGSPSIGADFGGPPALVPAFALLALMTAGVKITWRRLALVLGGAVAVVVSFSVLDWLRPAAERTHLGAFVDTVLDGGLWDVVWRKLEANVSTFRNPLALVGVAGLLVIVLVFGRPLRAVSTASGAARYRWLTGGAPLTQISTDAPMLTPGLICVGVALGIGVLVNDSGVVILGVGLSVLVPLVTATYAGWMLTLRRSATASAATP